MKVFDPLTKSFTNRLCIVKGLCDYFSIDLRMHELYCKHDGVFVRFIPISMSLRDDVFIRNSWTIWKNCLYVVKWTNSWGLSMLFYETMRHYSIQLQFDVVGYFSLIMVISLILLIASHILCFGITKIIVDTNSKFNFTTYGLNTWATKNLTFYAIFIIHWINTWATSTSFAIWNISIFFTFQLHECKVQIIIQTNSN